MEETYPEPPDFQGAGALVSKEYVDPRMPIRRKLEIRIKQKEAELTELKDALAALDKNPEYEKLHDILTKVSRFLG